VSDTTKAWQRFFAGKIKINLVPAWVIKIIKPDYFCTSKKQETA
jgi:hypothetical protein